MLCFLSFLILVFALSSSCFHLEPAGFELLFDGFHFLAGWWLNTSEPVLSAEVSVFVDACFVVWQEGYVLYAGQ